MLFRAAAGLCVFAALTPFPALPETLVPPKAGKVEIMKSSRD